MRTEKEMMGIILGFASGNDQIRAVALEGSRTNRNIPKDQYQDYDITFFVRDLDLMKQDDAWLSVFGNIIMMQKPEAMELFPPEILGFSYLMIFDDCSKIDLTLIPLDKAEEYLQGDQLIQLLLDKDNLFKQELIPSDIDYHIQKPTARMFDDCCNEFWFTATYVVKGLCRDEYLFAVDHLEIVRKELLRMISWQVGIQYGYGFSLGKHYKFLKKYIPAELWDGILQTYRLDSAQHVKDALLLCHQLFRQVSQSVGGFLQYEYPPYDKNITRYTSEMFAADFDGKGRGDGTAL